MATSARHATLRSSAVYSTQPELPEARESVVKTTVANSATRIAMLTPSIVVEPTDERSMR